MGKKNYHQVRKATVIQFEKGKRIKLGGYRPEQRRADDKFFRADRFGSTNLPAKVDLRPHMTPIENQGNTNSCTANAMAGAYEYLAKRLRGQADDVSRLFIYYNARDLDGDTSIDEGTYLRSCIEVLRKYGACLEYTWQFNPERIFEQPDNNSYTEAANFLIEEAERVEIDLNQMRSCLAEGYPFAFGLQLFGSFQKVGSTGLVPMPNPDREKHDGGHAMLCVGYSDPDKVFIVRNSWGEDWGDRGYCYIPYAYMQNPDLNSDCWTIRQVSEPVDLSEDIAGDDSSLFSDAIAAIVQSLQTCDNTFLEEFFNQEAQNFSYEEECIYTDEGFKPIDQIENIDFLYSWDDSDETEDSHEPNENRTEEATSEYEEDYTSDEEEIVNEDEENYEDEDGEEDYTSDEEEIVDEDEENYEDEDEDEEEDYTSDEDEEEIVDEDEENYEEEEQEEEY